MDSYMPTPFLSDQSPRSGTSNGNPFNQYVSHLAQRDPIISDARGPAAITISAPAFHLCVLTVTVNEQIGNTDVAACSGWRCTRLANDEDGCVGTVGKTKKRSWTFPSELYIVPVDDNRGRTGIGSRWHNDFAP